MDLALSIARSGLEAQHTNLEIISNNLANVDTPAFKKSRADFEDLPYQVQTQPGSATTQDTNTASGLVLGTGTKLVGTSKIYSDGAAINTGHPLDLMITGRGFFQVQLPNGGGYAYTRSGNFTLNEQGQMTTQEGYVLQPPITMPQGYTSVAIGQDGTVTATTQGTTVAQQVGQLQLADFVNPDGLQPIGQNLYLQTTASGSVTLANPQNNGLGMLTQNYLEGSNVSVVEEMVNLIEAQRSFEVTSKAVSTADNMMDYLNKVT